MLILSQFECETTKTIKFFLKTLPSKLFMYTCSSDPTDLEIYNQNSSSTCQEYELRMHSHLQAYT